MRRRRRSVSLMVAIIIVAMNRAIAQMYSYDPTQPPANGHIYFGSTKDADGNFLSGVTVALDVGETTYVMVTDEAGRFKIEVSNETMPSQVRFRCSKPGYIQLRAVQRLPPNKAPSPVQADCVLGRKVASAR
jgi:hypothetical protein